MWISIPFPSHWAVCLPHRCPEVHQTRFVLTVLAVATGWRIVKASHYQHPQRVILFYKSSFWSGLHSSSVSAHYEHYPARIIPGKLLPGWYPHYWLIRCWAHVQPWNGVEATEKTWSLTQQDKCQFLRSILDTRWMHKVPRCICAECTGTVLFPGPDKLLWQIPTMLYRLNVLIHSSQPRRWLQECTKAFQETRCKLMEMPVLIHFDAKLPCHARWIRAPNSVCISHTTSEHNYPQVK